MQSCNRSLVHRQASSADGNSSMLRNTSNCFYFWCACSTLCRNTQGRVISRALKTQEYRMQSRIDSDSDEQQGIKEAFVSQLQQAISYQPTNKISCIEIYNGSIQCHAENKLIHEPPNKPNSYKRTNLRSQLHIRGQKHTKKENQHLHCYRRIIINPSFLSVLS